MRAFPPSEPGPVAQAGTYMKGFYSAMSDLEMVGHVSAIPDASELSQALAGRVKLLAEELDEVKKELIDTKQKLLALELGLTQDKLAGFMDLKARAA